MQRHAAFADKIYNLGVALARQRGWAVTASARSRFFLLGQETRLAIEPKGTTVIVGVSYVIGSHVQIGTPEDLARALGVALADVTLVLAGPRHH